MSDILKEFQKFFCKLHTKNCKSPLLRVNGHDFSVGIRLAHFMLNEAAMKMEDTIRNPGWYCARTKPKHEHIAAATLRRNLGLEAFLPRLRIERATRRGAVRTIEPLFPCYVFVHCVIEESLDEIKHANGVSNLVCFGGKIPLIEDAIIEELQDCFEADEPMTVEHRLTPGSEVSVAGGAFDGMRAHVLRNMPAKRRVQILLDILGQPTPVEVDRNAVVLMGNTVAHLAPVLARESVCV